jgi:hypothetical protein
MVSQIFDDDYFALLYPNSIEITLTMLTFLKKPVF